MPPVHNFQHSGKFLVKVQNGTEWNRREQKKKKKKRISGHGGFLSKKYGSNNTEPEKK